MILPADSLVICCAYSPLPPSPGWSSSPPWRPPGTDCRCLIAIGLHLRDNRQLAQLNHQLFSKVNYDNFNPIQGKFFIFVNVDLNLLSKKTCFSSKTNIFTTVRL